MKFEDTLTALDKWAAINKSDKQLMGQYAEADFFEMVHMICDLARSHRALITKLEEHNKMLEAEIARLNTLVSYK